MSENIYTILYTRHKDKSGNNYTRWIIKEGNKRVCTGTCKTDAKAKRRAEKVLTAINTVDYID